MKLILLGASGMVGAGALREALASPDVHSVLSVGRRPSGVTHPKLREFLMADLFDVASVEEQLTGYDACIWAVGVSSVGLDASAYARVTEELTLVWARALLRLNPDFSFCYCSAGGAGGRSMWARVRQRVEGALQAMPFRHARRRPAGVHSPRPRHPESYTRLSDRHHSAQAIVRGDSTAHPDGAMVVHHVRGARPRDAACRAGQGGPLHPRVSGYQSARRVSGTRSQCSPAPRRGARLIRAAASQGPPRVHQVRFSNRIGRSGEGLSVRPPGEYRGRARHEHVDLSPSQAGRRRFESGRPLFQNSPWRNDCFLSLPARLSRFSRPQKAIRRLKF